jgi:RNA polymerase sigma-54 factor
MNSPLLSTALRSDVRQSAALSPRLQHAVRLLQMSSAEFAALLRDNLGSNPFLEVEEGEADAVISLPLAAAEDVAGASASEDGPASLDAPGAEVAVASDDSSDRDLWQSDGSGVRRADDGELSALEMTAAETPLNEHLHQQLNLLHLSERDLMLARAIVESLDDDGYLRTALAELLSVIPLEPPPVLEELQVALRHVQALEPAGVAARDVGECLRLQLDAIACPTQRTLARRIVDDHLDALAARDVQALARRLGQDVAQIEAVCDRIRHLDPRPGWRVGASAARYVVPDVIAKKVQGRWTVQLNPAVVPRVRLNQFYADLFQRHRGARNGEMSQHLQEARWTLRNVEQRFSTILAVAEAIVARQRHFLEFGAMAMRPLGLREIAEAVGVHESTVSRVTNNKYMATPNGVFELKFFFSRAMVSANGSACSATAIRSLIQDIIAAEDADAPLSDAEITRQLGRQGLAVARRTVTKYRQMLKVESVDRRRRHGG